MTFKTQRSLRENRDKRQHNASMAVALLNSNILPVHMARAKNRIIIELARYVPIKHQEAIFASAALQFGGTKTKKKGGVRHG